MDRASQIRRTEAAADRPAIDFDDGDVVGGRRSSNGSGFGGDGAKRFDETSCVRGIPGKRATLLVAVLA